MSKNRATRILIECQELLASVRVGVIEPLKPLVEKQLVEIRFKRTLEMGKEDIGWCDILICVRGIDYITLKIVEAAKSAGRYIIYFLDDDFLGLPSNLPGCEIFGDSKIKENIIKIINSSDILWCVNDLIGKKYGKYCNGSYILSKVPSICNTEKQKSIEGKIKILYAGSESHAPLVRSYLKPLVIKLNESFKDEIDITFIGANPQIKSTLWNNIHYVKNFENYDEYKGFVESGGFDIGLAIIGTDEFYQCKYYNKFIEYTSIGCVGVYTNSKPYTYIINSFENGILSDNTIDDWYDKVSILIRNTELRELCLQNAQKIILTEFSYEIISKKLVQSLPCILNYRAHNIEFKDIDLGNIKIMFIKERTSFLFRKYKLWFIPMVLFKVIKKISKKGLSVFNKKGV